MSLTPPGDYYALSLQKSYSVVESFTLILVAYAYIYYRPFAQCSAHDCETRLVEKYWGGGAHAPAAVPSPHPPFLMPMSSVCSTACDP